MKTLQARIKDQGFNSPHPNSLMGIALEEGDHLTVTKALDAAKVADDDLKYMIAWGKKGFNEFIYDRRPGEGA